MQFAEIFTFARRAEAAEARRPGAANLTWERPEAEQEIAAQLPAATKGRKNQTEIAEAAEKDDDGLFASARDNRG